MSDSEDEASLPNVTILQYMGIAPAARRNAIVSDFLSEGLQGLVLMTSEDVKDTCNSYAKRQDGVFPIILTPIQKQRLRALVLWVQDQVRVGQPLQFSEGVTQEMLRNVLDESLERETRRKTQKKEGESYLDSSFNNKLKSAAQYEKWNEELEATLCQIVGCRGVSLSYVIRKNEDPVFNAEKPYDEAVLRAIELKGVDYAQDARTVHKLILNNIHEDSNAYTYVKPLLRFRNGRKDILALRDRYSTDATRQKQINTAKSELSTLRYKNERSFSFEKFSAKLQKCYDDLEEAGRPVHNGDIVDGLWDRIAAPELQAYISSLKVAYQANSRDYKLILQDIAAEASQSLKQSSFGRTVAATYTRRGPCPSSGVYTSDGSIFIGKYDPSRWNSDSVRQHQKEILEARSSSTNDGGKSDGHNFSSRGQKRRTNAIKRNKKKLKALEAQISAAKSTLQSNEIFTPKTVHFADEPDRNHAGDAFGGRKAKRDSKNL